MKVYLVLEDDQDNREYPSVVLDIYQNERDAVARVTEEYARHGQDPENPDDADTLSWSVEAHELLTTEDAGRKLAELAEERRKELRQETARRLRALRQRQRSIREEIAETRSSRDAD